MGRCNSRPAKAGFMKVKILVSRAGLDESGKVFSQNKGDIVAMPDAEAIRLIEAGQAIPHTATRVKTQPKRRKKVRAVKVE